MKTLLIASTLLLTAGFALEAGPMLTLDPANGALTGGPGDTVGWGFTINGDPSNWVSITSSFLINESDPTVGFYSDFIGLNGGPVDAAIPPGTNWQEAFHSLGFLGTGAFMIDPAAQPGQIDTATLIVLYDIFSADPAQCTDCLLAETSFAAPVSVEVVSAPEPATLLLLLPAVLFLLYRHSRLCS